MEAKMDKRLMLALGVTSIWGSAESVYALAEQDRLIEERQHVRIKPSLSTKQTNKVNNSKLKFSISVKGGKNISSLQPPKNKKLSKKQIRAARKKFSLALKASKKKELSALIQAKKKARLSAKRNRKIILKIRKIERKRIQFRKKWERQEARLQVKKSSLLRRNRVALSRQTLQEQIALNRLKNPTTLRNSIMNSKKVESVRNIRLRRPVSSLGLKAPEMAKKIGSPVRKVTPPVRRVHSIMNSKKVESVRNIRLRTPVSSLGLKAPEMAKKIISPVRKITLPLAQLEGNPRKQANSSLLKTIAVKKIEGIQPNSSLLRPVAVRRNEKGQLSLRTANDSSEQSVARRSTVVGGNQEEQIRLQTDNDSSEQSAVIIPVVLGGNQEGQIRLETANDSSEQSVARRSTVVGGNQEEQIRLQTTNDSSEQSVARRSTVVGGNQEEQIRLQTDNDSSEQSAAIIPVVLGGNQEEQASLQADNDSSEQSAAIIPVVLGGNQEEQASLQADNDSSEQSAVIIPVVLGGNQEEQASLQTDNDSSEQSAAIIPVVLGGNQEEQASLQTDNDSSEQSAVIIPPGMYATDVKDNTELDNADHSPQQPISKGLTLKELELNCENLTPILRELTGKIWDFVENLSKEVSATSFRSLEALKEITNFTDAVNDMLQHINPSVRHENGLALDGGYDLDEGGYALEDFNDGEPLALYSQPQHEQAATQEEKDLKKDELDENDDLKKDQTFVPVVAEESDINMVIHATRMETLEKAIALFQNKAFHLRGVAEMGGSDDIEEKKANLRRLLTEAFTIETTLSSLKLEDSESTAESVNSLLTSHGESVGSEKVRLSMVLKNLLELEAKSKTTSSLSHSTPANDEKDKNVGLSDTSSMTPLPVIQGPLPVIQGPLPVIQGDGGLQTRTSTLDQKDIEPTDKSPLAAKSVTTDSDELSTRSFPTLLGSLNELLDRLVEGVGLKSDLVSNHWIIKMYSGWLKENLFSIETGEEPKKVSSIVSAQEEPYDFVVDMKDLRSKISHYLTLPTPSSGNDWLRNFKIDSGKRSAVHLIKEITTLNQKFEKEDKKEKD